MKFEQSKRIYSVAILGFVLLCAGCSSQSTTALEKNQDTEVITIETSDLEIDEVDVKDIPPGPDVDGEKPAGPNMEGERPEMNMPIEILEALKELSPDERKEQIQVFIDSGNYDEDVVSMLEKMKTMDMQPMNDNDGKRGPDVKPE